MEPPLPPSSPMEPPPPSLAAQISKIKQVRKTGSPMEPSKVDISNDKNYHLKSRHDWLFENDQDNAISLLESESVSKPHGSSINRDQTGPVFSTPPIANFPTHPPQQFIQPSIFDRNSSGILGARPEMNREGPREFHGFNRHQFPTHLQQQFDQPPVVDSGFKTQPSSPVSYFESSEIAEANGDFYMRAKLAEGQGYLEDACSLYCSAINNNDRYDSAIKDLAAVLKRLNRTDEAIDVIKQHLKQCSEKHKDSTENLLLNLYQGSGKIDKYIQLLEHKLELDEEGSAFDVKRTKIAGSQGRKCHVSIKQQRSRFLGSLAWAYMQQGNYHSAEKLYRDALFIKPDKNKQCHLAICLMKSEIFPKANSLLEAKSLLQAVTPSSEERKIPASYIKAYDRALKTLTELENGDSIED